MTAIVFHGESGSAQVRLGAGVELKIVGAALSAGGPILALFQSDAWYLGTSRFQRIICQGRVDVEFQAKSGNRTFGPFSDLTIDGAVVSTSLGVLARFRVLDEVWSFPEEEEAEIVVVKEHLQLRAAA